jgi:hypothetical protein
MGKSQGKRANLTVGDKLKVLDLRKKHPKMRQNGFEGQGRSRRCSSWRPMWLHTLRFS